MTFDSLSQKEELPHIPRTPGDAHIIYSTVRELFKTHDLEHIYAGPIEFQLAFHNACSNVKLHAGRGGLGEAHLDYIGKYIGKYSYKSGYPYPYQ